MGELIAGIAGGLLFLVVLAAVVYGIMRILNRHTVTMTEDYMTAEGRWETTVRTSGPVTSVIVRRMVDTRVGPQEAERITVANIRADSPTWTQDVLDAQAEADQRLAVLRSARKKG